MVPNDDLLKVELPGQEIPVNPHPHVFYLTSDPKVYNSMMRAIYKYMKTCADAQSTMYDEILKCMPRT
jgi:hypothetical protein